MRLPRHALIKVLEYRENIRIALKDGRRLQLATIHEDANETEQAAKAEIRRFRDTIRTFSCLENYFDGKHFTQMFDHASEARSVVTTLKNGSILEVVQIPTTDRVGFHIYNLFFENQPSRFGLTVGYAIYSLRDQDSTRRNCFRQIGIAFDIFPIFRRGNAVKPRIDRHEIYNTTRRILLAYHPDCFQVDFTTQIKETRPGDPVLRAGYYLKRGYYPTDPQEKAMADRILYRILSREKVSPRSIKGLLAKVKSPLWEFPMQPHKL
jgi:hypothetical protein